MDKILPCSEFEDSNVLKFLNFYKKPNLEMRKWMHIFNSDAQLGKRSEFFELHRVNFYF